MRIKDEGLTVLRRTLFIRGQVMDQEGENDHLMKTVMRALNSAQEKVLPITQVCPFAATVIFFT